MVEPEGCLICGSKERTWTWYCPCCTEAKEQVYREYEATGIASDAMRRHAKAAHGLDYWTLQRG